MAQIKTGIDYYAHNVGMTSDRRLRIIRREFGSVGIDVWFTLLDMIFSRSGYFLSFGEEERYDIAWDIVGEVRGKDSPTEEGVLDIITALVEAELFDKAMYERGILTSEAVQEQYYMSTLKRKIVTVDRDIWMLSVEAMEKLSAISPVLRDFRNDGISSDNDGRNDDNDGISDENSVGMEQSKVKESKEKNKKEKNIKVKQSKAKPPADEAAVGIASASPTAAEEIFSDVRCSEEEMSDALRSPSDLGVGQSAQPNCSSDERGHGSDEVLEENLRIISAIQEIARRNGGMVELKPEKITEEAFISQREQLVKEYGQHNVCKYEDRFREWELKHGTVRADMYTEIRKWMDKDIPEQRQPIPHRTDFSDIDPDEVMRKALDKYR